MNGIIFDIKEFTVHDGPGSRITVFFKGCPLRCLWCHNPEGLSTRKQLMYRSTLCTHCGRCYQACTHEECKPFGRCVHACVNGCLSIVGEKISSDQLSQKLNKNAELLNAMGGGITFSGGEPLLQSEFVCETVEKLNSVHKAIQTSGYAKCDVYKEVVSHFDYILQDIKLVDSTAHKNYTGVDNACILENIEWLKKSGKEFVFRVPLIPDITDTEDNLRAIGAIAEDHRVELMPFNSFAGAKYAMVGKEYKITNEKNREADFTQYFRNAFMVG